MATENDQGHPQLYETLSQKQEKKNRIQQKTSTTINSNKCFPVLKIMVPEPRGSHSPFVLLKYLFPNDWQACKAVIVHVS